MEPSSGKETSTGIWVFGVFADFLTILSQSIFKKESEKELSFVKNKEIENKTYLMEYLTVSSVLYFYQIFRMA